MSSIARFLQIQYELGRVTAEQLRELVSQKISEAEYSEIVGKENAA